MPSTQTTETVAVYECDCGHKWEEVVTPEAAGPRYDATWCPECDKAGVMPQEYVTHETQDR